MSHSPGLIRLNLWLIFRAIDNDKFADKFRREASPVIELCVDTANQDDSVALFRPGISFEHSVPTAGNAIP